MNEQTDKTSIQHGLEVAVEQFYKMLPALIGTLIGAAFLAWLTLRDHSDAIIELERAIAKAGECATAEQCAEIHRRLDALESKVLINTINRIRNEEAIKVLQGNVHELRNDNTARPGSLTDGRELEKRIKALEARP
jgi:hypothetical protein